MLCNKKNAHTGMLLAGILLLSGAHAPAQNQSSTATPVQIVKPVNEVRAALGITYPEDRTVGVKLEATSRLPKANGEAKVERKQGMTEVEIELDEMKPATLFGGDLATYVLWTVSPEGHVSNAGEFVLHGNRSKLNVSTPLETFGMFVTAEPHFLVRTPSRVVVLENVRPTEEIDGQMIAVSRIRYRGFEGVYRFTSESLAGMPEAKGEVRPDVQEARSAVELAKRAGAQQYASAEIAKALESLEKMMLAVEIKRDNPEEIVPLAHETVRLAYEAQIRAEERAQQAALDAERQDHNAAVRNLQSAIGSAQYEAARARSEAERARSEAERAQAESARAEALSRQREIELQREQQERDRALAEASAAREEAQIAKDAAERERQEREAARTRLLEALNRVIETRMTARGIIMNLPGVFFEFNQAMLRPQARETLSKVCGILQVARGYRLAIEGHTDSVGSDAYNATLSEHRAASVRDYLTGCGLSGGTMTTRGFGESNPIASNDTAEGRQRNRRVEIAVEDVESFQLSYLP